MTRSVVFYVFSYFLGHFYGLGAPIGNMLEKGTKKVPPGNGGYGAKTELFGYRMSIGTRRKNTKIQAAIRTAKKRHFGA